MEAERIAELFPPAAVVEAEVPRDHTAQLLDGEHAAIARAVARRRNEYSTGRVCARRAMSRLGVAPAPILVGDDRAPGWPDGIVGSISHTHGLCAVVVARATEVGALGLDLEPDEAVGEDLYERICTAAELRALPAGDEGRAVRLLFCAKEAFYKLQYPRTRTFLGFQAVEVEIEANAFTVTLQQHVDTRFAARASFTGRWRRDAGFLVTAMSLPI